MKHHQPTHAEPLRIVIEIAPNGELRIQAPETLTPRQMKLTLLAVLSSVVTATEPDEAPAPAKPRLLVPDHAGTIVTP